MIIGLGELWRNRKVIMWKETLWYNGMRSLCAGFVGGILGVMMGQGNNPLMGVLGAPLMYFFVLLPLAFFVGMTIDVLPFMGWVALFVAFVAVFVVAIGDPLVFLIKKVFPNAVPVDEPAFFSIRPVIPVVIPQALE